LAPAGAGAQRRREPGGGAGAGASRERRCSASSRRVPPQARTGAERCLPQARSAGASRERRVRVLVFLSESTGTHAPSLGAQGKPRSPLRPSATRRDSRYLQVRLDRTAGAAVQKRGFATSPRVPAWLPTRSEPDRGGLGAGSAASDACPPPRVPVPVRDDVGGGRGLFVRELGIDAGGAEQGRGPRHDFMVPCVAGLGSPIGAAGRRPTVPPGSEPARPPASLRLT